MTIAVRMNRSAASAYNGPPVLCALALLLLAPRLAHAQHLSVAIVAGALSPVAVCVLAVLVGFVARSWRLGAMHVAVVIVWVALFVIASQWVENDYVIWTPIALYVMHALLLLVLLVVGIAKRVAGRTHS